MPRHKGQGVGAGSTGRVKVPAPPHGHGLASIPLVIQRRLVLLKLSRLLNQEDALSAPWRAHVSMTQFCARRYLGLLPK